jgi:hypothetical protein
MGHAVASCRSMPVFFGRRYPDAISSLNNLWLLISKPDKADTTDYV